MPSKEVAPVRSALPDLAPTPATSISAEDIAIPRIYIGQALSTAVQEGLMKTGQLFYGNSAEDPDPQLLDQPTRIHVLHFRKAKSWSPGPGMPLETWDFDDPSQNEQAYTTYNYTLCLPEIDTEMPFKLLLARSSAPAARSINTVLMRNASQGPAWVNAFDLTTAERKKENARYAIAQVRAVTPVPAHVEIADALGRIVLKGEANRQSYTNHGELPEI